MNKINYGKQFIDNPDKVYLKKNLNNSFITQGPIVKKFEEKICNYLNVNYAVTCNSGTSALLLALLSIDLKPGDNIIMPSVNFIASYNMSKFLKARIFLADVNSSTGQMDPKNVVDCIKKNKIRKIKAIITMYLGGSPENIIDFYKLKKKYNFYLVEDACHAFGSEYFFKNKKFKIGSCKHSDIATFSFHPLKTITTGEGGALTTNKYNLFKKIKELRSHSIIKSKKNYWKYNAKNIGFNFRLSDINCSLGITQLGKINKILNKRRKVAKIYGQKFEKLNKLISIPKYQKSNKSSWHLYLVKFNFSLINSNKDKLIKYLIKKSIYPQQHYMPIYYFDHVKGYKIKDFPNSREYYNNTISLPIYYELKNKHLNKVFNTVVNFLKNKNFKKF